MRVSTYGATDVGRVKENNEDSYLLDAELGLYVVADGMGGHAAGEVASKLAVDEVKAEVVAKRGELERLVGAGKSWEVQAILDRAVQRASEAVFNKAREESGCHGMGTTLSVLWIWEGHGVIAHVGDSRVYIRRSGEVHLLTEDHSLLRELIKQGREKEVDSMPYASALTRAVGVQPYVEVDTLDFDVLPGDEFLVCSDGLHGYVKREEIAEAFAAGVDSAPKKLVDLANERGGRDNITVALVAVEGEITQERGKDAVHKYETCKQMPLFRYLSFKELIKVLNLTRMRHVKKGQVLLAEGHGGSEIFIVVSGRLRIEKGGIALGVIEAGGHVGEMSLIDRNPRSATVNAEEDARLLVLARSSFYALLRSEPALSVKLLWNLLQVISARLRSANRELVEIRADYEALMSQGVELFHVADDTGEYVIPRDKK